MNDPDRGTLVVACSALYIHLHQCNSVIPYIHAHNNIIEPDNANTPHTCIYIVLCIITYTKRYNTTMSLLLLFVM